MNKVYKYLIPFRTKPYQEFEISMPADSNPLKVTQQKSDFHLYAYVNLGSSNKIRYFFLVWTGADIETVYQYKHIDTFTDIDGLVYHLFEILH